MTRKPQTAWALQVDWGGRREPFIDPNSVGRTEADADRAFWADCEDFREAYRHFRTGVYKFVKVNITPVEDNQK